MMREDGGLRLLLAQVLLLMLSLDHSQKGQAARAGSRRLEHYDTESTESQQVSASLQRRHLI